MKYYSADQIKNIAFLGHGNSGKTTLADAVLCYGKAVERIGKTADGTSVFNFDAEEKKRGTTVGTAVFALPLEDKKINLIDAPGLFDFAGGGHTNFGIVPTNTGVFSTSAKHTKTLKAPPPRSKRMS